MGVAAYKAVIKSSGTATAMVDEPMEEVGVATGIYQIINPAKQVISLDHSYTITIDGVVQSPGDITADLIAGKFEIAGAIGAVGPFIISAHYIPLAEVVGGNAYKLDIGGDVLDDSSFDACRANGGHRTKLYGIHDVSFSIERHSNFGQTFINYKRNRERVLIEVAPGGGEDGAYAGKYRGWFFVETAGLSGDIGDLEAESITFNLAGNNLANFSFIPFVP